MNQAGSIKTLSKEERKQIMSLLEMFSKLEIQMALRQLTSKKIKLN
ncbi:hypothetical protein [Mesobacillus foraminis]|nr:hypothetical protein [Mesobacillus foraminis]